MSDFLKGWLQSDAARRDSINVKRIYIDICGGNLIDAVIFSQIMYWHEPGKNGKPRLAIKREGHLWLARRYEDWWEDCRVLEHTARNSIARMVESGLLIKRLWHYDGKPTVHLRVDPKRFQQLVQAVEDGTIDELLKPAPSDTRGQLPNGISGQIDNVSNLPEMTNGNDLSGQIASRANRPERSDARTETSETIDDDDLTDQSHHQDFDARTRELLAQRFEEVGIAESVWREWLRHSDEHLLACILHAQAEGTNPPGLLRSMLDSDGVPLPKYAEKARRLLRPKPIPPPAPLVALAPAIGLDEKPGGGLLTIRDIWSAVVGQLRLQLNRDTFANVRDAVVLSYADGVITVRPRLPYAALWFDRAREMLDKVVSDVAGVPIAVRCEGQNEVEPAAHEGAAGSRV